MNFTVDFILTSIKRLSTGVTSKTSGCIQLEMSIAYAIPAEVVSPICGLTRAVFSSQRSPLFPSSNSRALLIDEAIGDPLKGSCSPVTFSTNPVTPQIKRSASEPSPVQDILVPQTLPCTHHRQQTPPMSGDLRILSQFRYPGKSMG